MYRSNSEDGASDATCSLSRREMRHSLSFTIIVLLSWSAVMIAPQAHSFYEIGRGELLLHTRGTAMYDSNVLALEDPEDDFLFSLNPELEYVRRAGRSDVSIFGGVVFGRFLDNTDLDFEDYYAGLSVGYPVPSGSRFGGGVELSVRQDTTLSEFLNQRITRDRYTGTINNRYRVNERVGFRNSFRYTRTDRTGFSRVNRIEGSLGAVYFYSENLDFDVTYRLGRTTTAATADRGRRVAIDHSVTVGATGDLTEKVTGNTSVGFRTRRIVRGDRADRVHLIFGVGLSWAARANSAVSLDASRDMDLSPEGRSVERTTVRLGVTQGLTEKMSGSAFTGYRLAEFSGDTSDRDDTFLAGAGLNYSFTMRWTGELEYTFMHTESERRDVTFDRHTVSLSTSYTF